MEIFRSVVLGWLPSEPDLQLTVETVDGTRKSAAARHCRVSFHGVYFHGVNFHRADEVGFLGFDFRRVRRLRLISASLRNNRGPWGSPQQPDPTCQFYHVPILTLLRKSSRPAPEFPASYRSDEGLPPSKTHLLEASTLRQRFSVDGILKVSRPL